MELKKHDKANLEKKRGVFIQLGFVITLIIAVVAFEWKTPKNISNQGMVVDIDMELAYIPTIQRKQKLNPPLPKPHLFTEISVIEDDGKPIKELEPIDAEISENDAVKPVKLEREEEEAILLFAETMPEFPGGMKTLKKFIRRNLRYPEKAKNENIQGKVYVRFMVNRTGKIENVNVVQPVHPLLDKEAVRIVRTLPDWRPAYQNGRPVSVWYTIPVVFVLQ